MPDVFSTHSFFHFIVIYNFRKKSLQKIKIMNYIDKIGNCVRRVRIKLCTANLKKFEKLRSKVQGMRLGLLWRLHWKVYNDLVCWVVVFFLCIFFCYPFDCGIITYDVFVMNDDVDHACGSILYIFESLEQRYKQCCDAVLRCLIAFVLIIKKGKTRMAISWKLATCSLICIKIHGVD